MEEGHAVLMRERFDDNYEEKVVLHANVYSGLEPTLELDGFHGAGISRFFFL